MKKILLTTCILILLASCKKDPEPGDQNNLGFTFWLDRTFTNDENQDVRIAVWFEDQLIGFDEDYITKTQEEFSEGRLALRERLIGELKAKNNSAMASAKSVLDALVADGKISNIEPIWIVNGFICDINPGALEGLSGIPEIHSIFRYSQGLPNYGTAGPEFSPSGASPFEYDANTDEATWSVEAIGAPRVWSEFGITGKGVKNAIHDLEFTFDLDVISASLYRNPNEIPGNDIDDDQNGLVDDYHGYNFDEDNTHLNTGTLFPGGIVHGNSVAGIIVGRDQNGEIQGVAPDSQWGAILAVNHFAQAVQWALEHDFDTYNMSFSFRDLGEFRSYWRKVSEHASLCGLVLISGAGNFGDPNNPNFVAVPKQMRIPEDIPEAVLGVAGVNSGESVPIFSSKGPVVWDTHHYNEGSVQKPDFATYNTNVTTFDIDGAKLTLNGNSFAGPHMSGVVSLMLEANPNLHPWEVKQILIETAKDIDVTGNDVKTGHGLVNAYEAVRRAMN